MLVSKTREKTRENARKTREKREKTREKPEKNPRKTREKSKTRAQRKTMFLYYTMRWVKTQVSCVLVAFWSRFGHKHCQNANPTHSVIRPLKSFIHSNKTHFKGIVYQNVDIVLSFCFIVCRRYHLTKENEKSQKFLFLP